MNPHDLHVNKKMWWYRRLVGVLEQGRIQDFKLGGALKKLRRAEEGAKFVEVFRVKKYDFTPILGGGAGASPLDPSLWRVVFSSSCSNEIQFLFISYYLLLHHTYKLQWRRTRRHGGTPLHFSKRGNYFPLFY